MSDPRTILTRRLSSVIPKGFKCAEEWAGESSLSATHALRLLKDGMKAGQFERKQFLNQNKRPTWYFRLLEK